MNFTSFTDWYKIDFKAFENNNGYGFITNKLFNGSPSTAVMLTFPEHHWEIYKFKHHTKGYWELAENRKDFMTQLGQKLGFTKMEDWYNIDAKAFSEYVGYLNIFKNSPVIAVMHTFPLHNWEISRFKRVGNEYWTVRENRKEYLEWLGKKLGFVRMEDWYGIDMYTFKYYVKDTGKLQAGYLTFANARKAVIDSFPLHDWNLDFFRTIASNNLTEKKYRHEFLSRKRKGQL